jgi:hypothetical protein
MLANFTHLDELANALGLTHILVSPDDYATEFEPADRQRALGLLLENPRHKKIYSEDGFTVLEIEPRSESGRPKR